MILGITDNGLFKVLYSESNQVRMARSVRIDESVLPAQITPSRSTTFKLADSENEGENESEVE